MTENITLRQMKILTTIIERKGFEEMNKMKEIIKNNFDERMDAMVICYIMSKGWEFCSSIDEEDLKEVEGNGLMTREFVVSMIKTATEVVRNCDMFNDFIPYVVERFKIEEDDSCMY